MTKDFDEPIPIHFQRKPGRTKLVYDKELKAIVSVSIMTPKEPTVKEMLNRIDLLQVVCRAAVDDEEIAGEICACCPDPRCRYEIEAICALIQSKRTVTPGQVDLWAVRIRDDSNLGLMHVRYLLYSMLADLGIVIEEGK